jgi:hypothetical protein
LTFLSPNQARQPAEQAFQVLPVLRSSAFVLAGTGTRTEIAASIVQAVSFEGIGPSTATIDMIAVCTVVGTKIAGSGP